MDKRKNDTESRESTVLSDPHKKEAPKTKPRGKIVLSVIAAVLVAFVLVPYGIVKITGAANKRSAAPVFEQTFGYRSRTAGKRAFRGKT